MEDGHINENDRDHIYTPEFSCLKTFEIK